MGTMVNLSNDAGLFGIRLDRDYIASKKGVVGLTQAGINWGYNPAEIPF